MYSAAVMEAWRISVSVLAVTLGTVNPVGLGGADWVLHRGCLHG